MLNADPPDGAELLARLEARLDRAASAAEGLLAEAARSVPRRPPPAGWEPQSGAHGEPGREAEVVAGLLEAVRERVPPELQRRIAEALRELLVALRSLIDWYLERVAGRHDAGPEVEEIPID